MSLLSTRPLAQQHVGSSAAARRAASIRAAQKPVITELGQVHASRVKQYQTITRLPRPSQPARRPAEGQPAIAQVIPDVTINASFG